MASACAFDYVRDTHAVCQGFLSAHRALLEAKGIQGMTGLIQAIKQDFEKLDWALAQLRERSAADFLAEFFAPAPALGSALAGRLGTGRIGHIGFEIVEPMDVVAHGLRHWADKVRADQGTEVEIVQMRRFPASAALQRRVGAYVEIMCLSLVVEGRPLTLELFDAHGPACRRNPWLGQAGRRFGPFGAARPARRCGFEVFQGDRLWHYAIVLDSAESVWQAHETFSRLAQSGGPYRLPYADPVANAHEGSLHTKLINTAQGLELEFVAQSGKERPWACN
jgi:hypothetical protein